MSSKIRSLGQAGDTASTESNFSSARDRLRREKALVLGLQVATAVTLLVSWELVSDFLDAQFWISSPTAIVTQLQSWIDTGVLWNSLRATLIETGLGFIIGAVSGAIVGFILGRVHLLGKVLEPFVLSLYTLPKIALAPLFVLWFGIGVLPKVMFAALLVFFLVFFTTFQGARQTDERLIEIARVMGASKWDVLRKIVLPHSAIWMFAGFRIGLPYALIGAVVGEFIAAQEGIGFLIKAASSLFNTAGVFAGLLVLMLLALIMLALLQLAERKILKWQNPGESHGSPAPTP